MGRGIPHAILVDIDDTLMPYHPCHEKAMEAFASEWQKLGLGAADDSREAYRNGRRLVHNKIRKSGAARNRLLYIQRALEIETGRCDYAAALKLYDTYWEAYLESLSPFKGAAEWLETVSVAGARIAAVSDLTASVQFRKLERTGLARFVPLIVTSEEAGAEKPDPRPFLLALEKTGSVPGQTCFVGDSVDRDIMPSLRMGMSAVLARVSGGVEEAGPAPEGVPVVTSFRTFFEEAGWT
jgi:putative hydrolase of the HAD superfamily